VFENLRADLRLAAEVAQIQPGSWVRYIKLLTQLTTSAVMTHRFAHWVLSVRVPIVRQLLLILSFLLRRWVGLWTGVIIFPEAEIGPGFHIHSPYGIFIGRIRIGANCTVQTGVVISDSTLAVGDNVYFGPGAKVVGDIKIGNNVVIMPNSTILTDVADNTTIVGVPARIKLRNNPPKGSVGSWIRSNHTGSRRPTRAATLTESRKSSNRDTDTKPAAGSSGKPVVKRGDEEDQPSGALVKE